MNKNIIRWYKSDPGIITNTKRTGDIAGKAKLLSR